MGIPDDRAFICFHARDNAFLDKEQPVRDWRYHDFRDASIENFLLAAGEMAGRGYFAVRMGSVVKGPLLTNNPMIIDYSVKFRSDFLDVFLLAKCRFLIGTNCGVTDLADILRRPVVKTNATQFGAEVPLCGSKDLFIPKKFWLKDEKRFVTFRELMNRGLRLVVRTEEYEQCGLEVIENSAEEILDATVEMDERLKGTWQTTEEDEELQGRFWKIVTQMGWIVGPPVSRISSRFLRQNQYLLD
jgi:putative glycosyltransferase (TIGR04372 family)